MITAKDLVENNGLKNPIFDEFIKEHIIPEYDETGGYTLKIWHSSWSRVYDQYWANGMLQKALELRGFIIECDYEDEALHIIIPTPEGYL